MIEVKEYIRRLRPIDDVFFEKLAEDSSVCEEILRVILNEPELRVLSVTPQMSVKNLWGRSVRLDALCRLHDGTLCNLEVQKSDDDDHHRRVRYNEACITANNTKTGTKFVAVPDVTMVYISSFDIFKGGKTIYHCRTMTDETSQQLDNGLTEIYVNTKVNDGTELSELMACFLQENVENDKFPCLSRRVSYLKNSEEGVEIMCKIVDEYINEVQKESIRNLFMNGVSFEAVLKSFAQISEDIVSQIYEEVTGSLQVS